MMHVGRSVALLGLFALTAPLWTPSAGAATQGRLQRPATVVADRVALDLGDFAEGASGVVFVDAMKQASPWSASGALELDRLGNVTELARGQVAEATIYAPGTHYPAGDYTLLYSGIATWGVVGGTIVAQSAGRTIVRVDAGATTGLRLRLLSTEALGERGTGRYAHDVRLILPGFERTYATQPFAPDFMRSLAHVQLLRFATWMRANAYAASASWPGRPATQRFTQATADGIAPEYMIALANATGADPWFTLPVGATNFYAYAFAQLVRQQLSPRLHPVFEYGDEVWRAGSAANGWARMAGANYRLAADPSDAALAWYGQRSAQVLGLVRQAFGADARRVTGVIGIPPLDAGGAQVARRVLADATGADADALAVGMASAGPATERFARAAGLAVYRYGRGPTDPLVRGGSNGWNGAAYAFSASPVHPAVDGPRAPHPAARLAPAQRPVDQEVARPSLVGMAGTPLRAVDLAREGTTDWMHAEPGRTERSAGAAERIGDLAIAGTAHRATAGFATFIWHGSGGKPARSGSGLSLERAGDRFSLTVPADTTRRILRVYVGAAAAHVTFRAALSDGSARPYADASLGDTGVAADGVYSLVYSASKPNQRLSVTFTLAEAMGAGARVSFYAATLRRADARAPQSPASAVTFHYDNARDGWDQTETQLTTANVASGGFGLLKTLNVDGVVLAQPLYVAQYNVPSQGVHNLLVVVTENDTVYEFDADTYQIINQRSMGTAQSSDDVGCSDIEPQYGITDTPVIDLSTNTIYLVAATEPAQNNFHHTLHALDIGTLADQQTPVDIAASVKMSNGATINFDPQNQQTRTSLTESNGNVYVGVGSHCDNNAGNIVGWMLEYNSSLQQIASFATAEDSQNYLLSSIWMSGYASAVDDSGNIFTVTGNGAFDAGHSGGRDYGESAIKLDPSLTSVQTFFTPKDWQRLNDGDVDFGSGGIMLLPQQQARVAHVAVAMGKDSNLFLLNQNHLGRVGSPLQKIATGGGGVWGGPAFYDGPSGQFVFYQTGGSPVTAYKVTVRAGKPRLVKETSGNSLAGYGGSSPVVSSNGQTPGSGIVWLVEREATLTLEAYDATNLANMVFSGSAGTWSNPENNGFVTPLVANGKVYVPATGTVTVFGLP
jgi:hypothetical protein